MKLFSSMLLSALTVVMSQPSRLEAADDAAQIMMDLSQTKFDSLSSIRVKIFPHDKAYKPHGSDAVRERFVVEAEKPCALFRGAVGRATATGGVIRRSTSFTFSALELHEPQLLVCPGTFRLLRQGLPSNLSFDYRGRLYIQPAPNSEVPELEAINVISFEEYLRGVVPSEVYKEWPMETLKTQAVAARTYAAYHVVYARRFHADRMWDVDDTINYQAYTGEVLVGPRTDQAVATTQGQILTYQGQVIQAFYHADSGGQTEEALAVWSRQVPFTIARPEAGDMELSKTIWERSVSLSAIEQDLKATGWLDPEQTLRQLLVPVIGRTPSGRVRSLAAIDQKGRFKLIPFHIFRRIVPQLPSQLFAIERSKDNAHEIVIHGIGNGHGVGMSQMGAAALAGEKAWSYQQILEYYYVRTTLCTLQETNDDEIPNCYKESARYAANKQEAQATPPI